MTPSYCKVCGRCFQNQYFHTKAGGDFVHFADYDDSLAKQGYIPGIAGAAWICDQHLPLAHQCTHMPENIAVSHMRELIGLSTFAYSEGLDEPHLFVEQIGPNRAKVFAILRAATGMKPELAKEALEHLPVLVASGWPASFKAWEEELNRCGAHVSIVWD